MALQKGTENKRQVYILAALGVVLVCVGGYEIKDNFFSSAPTAAPPAVVVHTATAQTAPAAARTVTLVAGSGGQEAQKLSNAGIDPALHLDKLALSEDVEYLGTGRNIFSAESVPEPVKIENPVASARPGQTGYVPPSVTVPAKPTPPAIDLKYFGYTQAKDKSFQAFCSRG